jgi:hypothetical protein
LCDSALLEANAVRTRHEETKFQRVLAMEEEEEEEEEEPQEEQVQPDTPTTTTRTTTTTTTILEPPPQQQHQPQPVDPVMEMEEEGKDCDLFDWSDAGQVKFQDLERIHVNEPDAAGKVTQSRLAGIPVVITGHKGWAQFAAKWLEPEPQQKPTEETNEKKIPDIQLVSPCKNVPPPSPPSCVNTFQQQQQQPISSACEESFDLEQEFDRIIKEVNPNSPHPKNQGQNQSEKGGGGEKTTAEESMEEDELPVLLDLSKPHKINIKAMIADIGEELVPILRKKYDETNPIKGHVRVRKFLENPNCWPQENDETPKHTGKEEPINSSRTNGMPTTMPLGTKKSGAALYMHQWQFPTSETAVPKLCGRGENVPLPNGILGDDLLKYWLDEHKCAGDSVYQYLFMGNAGTMSKLHKDPGGLVITIAPIVGKKEVVLAHRADGATALYHLDADLEKIDLHRFPLLYSARLWKTTLVPGEILLMPEATYHQCRNVTPCLSYSRFYLDTVNLKAFFESWRDQDAPEIDHLEILWNAASELSKQVDNFVEQFRKHDHVKNSEVPATILSAIESLRTFRNIAREITLRCQQTEDPIAVEWNDMVGDIDDSLHRFRFRLRKREPPFRRRQLRKSPSKKRNNPKNRKAMEATMEDDSADVLNNIDKIPLTSFFSEHKKLPNLSPEEVGKMLSDNTHLSVGDTIAVHISGKRVDGKIIAIQDPMRAAFVDYDEFLDCDSEFLPLECLRIPVIGGESSAEIDFRTLQPNMPVYKLDNGEEYRAVIKYWRHATFYHTELSTPDSQRTFQRWMTRENMLEKIVSPPHDASAFQNQNTIVSETCGDINGSFIPKTLTNNPVPMNQAIAQSILNEQKQHDVS